LQLGRHRAIKSLQPTSNAEQGVNTFVGNLSTPAEFFILLQMFSGKAALNEFNRQYPYDRAG